MLKRTLIFLTIGLAVMACTESDEYASAVIACQPGTALGVIENDLFTTRADPDNATHAAGYCVNTSELKEYCVTLQGATNTYACSKQASGMLFCGDKEVKALTDNENCGRCGNRCGENALCRNGICETNEKTSDCADFDSSRCNLNEMCRVQYRGTENAVARCAFTDEYCLSNYTNGRFDVDAWECVESENPPAKTCEEFDVTQCHTGEVCRVRNAGTENSLATCAYSDAYCQENYTNGYFDTNEWSCKQPKTCEDDHAPACTGNEICRVKTEGAKQVAVCAPSDDVCASQKPNGYFNEESWACEEPPVAKSCEEENAPNCGTGKVCRVKDEGTEQAQAVCAPSDAYCAENYINGVFKAETWSCIADTDGDGKFDDEDECPYNAMLTKKLQGKDAYNECFKVGDDGKFYIYHARNLEELAYNSNTTDENNTFMLVKEIYFKNDINMGDLDNTMISGDECVVNNWDYPDFNLGLSTDGATGVSIIDGEDHNIVSVHPETGQRCSLPRALFNRLGSCGVKNINLDFDVKGNNARAMLANNMNKSFYYDSAYCQNVHYSGLVKTSKKYDSVGGLVASVSASTFTDCVANHISVDAEKSEYVGGLVGLADSDSGVTYPNHEVSVVDHIIGHKYVGGILGDNPRGRFTTGVSGARLVFDTIEKKYDSSLGWPENENNAGYVGGIVGSTHYLSDCVVVGNTITGNEYGVAGGLGGSLYQASVFSSAIAIDEISSKSVANGIGDITSSSCSFSVVLTDNGTISAPIANGGFSYNSQYDFSVTMQIISANTKALIADANDARASGLIDFYYSGDSYPQWNSISMNAISSRVSSFSVKYSDYTRAYSGLIGYYTSLSDYKFPIEVKNSVAVSNRQYPYNAIFNRAVTSSFGHENLYYYFISDSDIPFSEASSGDNSFKVNENNTTTVVGKLNTTLATLKEEISYSVTCTDCSWQSRSFHNNTSDKDVNLPYLKLTDLENTLSTLKSAHCEAFGAKSKFCP